jgi:hypothetical protein
MPEEAENVYCILAFCEDALSSDKLTEFMQRRKTKRTRIKFWVISRLSLLFFTYYYFLPMLQPCVVLGFFHGFITGNWF